MALLVLLAAAAGARIVAADFFALSLERLYVIASSLRLAGLGGLGEGGGRGRRVVEGEVARQGSTAGHRQLGLAHARWARGGGSSDRALRSGRRDAAVFHRTLVAGGGERLVEEDPLQDLLVRPVHQGLVHLERLLLVLDQGIALAVAAQPDPLLEVVQGVQVVL